MQGRCSQVVLSITMSAFVAGSLSARLWAATIERDVTYRSGPYTLAATLYIPEADSLVPGVVLVHGSGNSSRSNVWLKAYVEDLNKRGVAVLFPDKRGCGESEGDWKTATFDDLSDDVIAGARFLRSQPEIDTTRLTVAGFSQGSHIISIAASAPEVKLAISVSGSVAPITEQIRDEVRIMGEKEGLPPEIVASVDTLNLLVFRYAESLANGTPDYALWSHYDNLRLRLIDSQFGKSETISGFPDDSTSSKFSWLGTVGVFNPLPHWRRSDTPVLFVYGARDENVDVSKSVSVICDSLTDDEIPYSLLVMGQNAHGLIRDDCTDFIVRWISDRGAP